MGRDKNQMLLTIFFSITLFSAQAICVPRSSSHLNPSPAPISPSPQQQPVSCPGAQLVSSSPDNAPTSSHFSNPPSQSATTPTSETLNASPLRTLTLSSLRAEPAPSSPPAAPKSGSAGQPSTAANSEIKKICDATDNPLLCISSISPFLTGKTDPLSVLEMAIKASAEHAKLALAAATRFSATLKIDSTEGSNIDSCRDSYNDALDNLQSALDATATSDVGTMNSMLSAAISDVSDCEDAFTGAVSPLATFDNSLKKMVSNCLAIVSLIK